MPSSGTSSRNPLRNHNQPAQRDTAARFREETWCTCISITLQSSAMETWVLLQAMQDGNPILPSSPTTNLLWNQQKVRIAYSLGEPDRKILNYIVVAHSIGNIKKQAAGHALVQPPTDRTAASYWHEERASGTHTDAPQVKPHHTVKLGQLLCIMSDINNPCTMNTVKLEHESRKEIVRLFLSMTCTSYSTCYVPVHVSTHHMY